MSSNQLNDISKVYLEAVYGGGKKEEKDSRMVVTNADKKANTPAYQKYKAGNKAYKAADHMKEDIVDEGALVKAAQGAEKVGGAIVKGGKAVVKGVRRANRAIDKADRAVTKATMNRVVKPVAKAAGKAAVGTAKAAGRAVVGGVKGAVKGALNKEQLEFARHKASIISRGGRLEDAVESWNKKMAHREAMKNVEEQKEVNVKDTYKTVAAIVDYDRSKKGSKDATYDSMHGDKKKAKKERDYAAFEREKMKKDDPNWKSKKYHTGMHGESMQHRRNPEGSVKDRFKSKQTDPSKDNFTGIGDDIGEIMRQNAAMKKAAEKKKAGVSEEYGKKKKKKHHCASKVKHEEFGIGDCIKGMHDLDESGNVAHYDVEFEEYIVENVPVEELEILEASMHEHVIYTEQKKAAKDYDGDGKIESGKDEYFGSRDKAIKKAMGKKVKKESLSDWRTDLEDLIEIVDEPESKAEKEVVEKKVKNKVIINPKFTEAVEEMGGELLEMVEITEEYAPEIEAATEYFYSEGINEDGLDAIIEEVGLDTFVEFVIDSAQDLNEQRAARKMTARNLQTLKKKTIPAAKEAEAKRKKEGKGEYSAAYKKKETDVTVYDDKPKAKAKAKPKAKPAAKKVAAVTKQVKKLQPAKKPSKQGIGDKIRGAIKKGVARHQAARAKGREPEKRVKEFGKGFASGVKSAVKFAGDVKKVVSKEELEMIELDLEIQEAERKLADRLARKRKLYDKTTKKAMDDARRTGEASGHNRFRMGSLDREMDGIKAKMNKEAKVYGYQGGGKVMGYQGGGKVMGYQGGGKVMGYQQGGLVKKELKSLKKGAETLKGKNIAKADSM